MARNLVWVLGGGTVAAAAAVAVWIVAGMQPGNVSTGTPAAAPAAASSGASPGVTSVAAAPAEPAPATATAAEPPRFDVVRVARDGEALVAGSAAPGSAVTLRVDGVSVAEAAADGSGQFVAMFSLGTSTAVQVMTLEMEDAAGTQVPAEDTVILTPRPVQVAAAEAPAAVIETASEQAVVAGPAPEVGINVTRAVPGPEGEPLARTEAPVPAPAEVAAAPAPAPSDDGSAGQGGIAALPASVAEGDAAPVAEAPVETVAAGGLTAAVPAETLAAAPDASPPPAVPAAPEVSAPMGALAAADSPEEPVTRAATAVDTVPAAPAAAPESPAAAPVEVIAAAPVPAEAEMPTAFLLRGDGGVEVLDHAPSVMDNVIIDSISYSDGGDVQISGRAGRASPGADLRIYLDNRPIAVAQAERGDWRLDLPAIDPGVYTLRVDQLTAEGRVESRFETPFQREAPELIAAARARAAGSNAAPAAPAAAPAPAPVEVAAASRPEPVTQAAPAPAEPAPPAVALITVQPGHTLWHISRERYGAGERYVIIYRANRSQIRDPDLIYPGQVFTLPEN